ncbi:MAG: hypothetical protein R3E89_05690 [Thiolinea sp.]
MARHFYCGWCAGLSATVAELSGCCLRQARLQVWQRLERELALPAAGRRGEAGRTDRRSWRNWLQWPAWRSGLMLWPGGVDGVDVAVFVTGVIYC